jgi:hypothetical protein
MKKIFKIIIAGPRTSGKTTLLHMLDGEKNVVNFHHDKILCLFNKIFLENDENKVQYKKDLKKENGVLIYSKSLKNKKHLSLRSFRKYTADIGYADIEAASFYNKAPSHFSIKSFYDEKIVKKHKFEFDFFNFEKKFKFELFRSGKKDFTYEEVIDLYFSSYISNLKNKSFNKSYNIVFKSPNEIKTIEHNLKELRNAKFVYIKRDILGLVKSRALDLKIRDNYRRNTDYYFERILHSRYLGNILKTYKKVDFLKQKYKNFFFITSLEQITNNTRNEMEKIILFLGLKKKECYFFPSYLGRIVKRDHLSKINDDAIKISNDNKVFFSLRLKGLSFFIKNRHKIPLVQLIKHFFIMLKNYFRE